MVGLAADVAAGAVSGIIYAAPYAAATPNPLLVFAWYVAPFPLLFRALTGGPTSALLAGPAGLITVALATEAIAALGYLFLQALPAMWLALRAGSEMKGAGVRIGRIASELAVYASLCYLAVLAWHGFRLDGLTGGLREALQAALDAGEERLPPQAADLTASFARFFPGFFGAWWMVMMMGNAAIAQGIAATSGRARYPTPTWSAFRTTRYLAILFMAATLPAAVLGEPSGPAFAGLAMILGVPLLCQGLAVIHAASRGFRLRRLALGACYVSMLVWPIAPVAFALLAALGTVDHAGRFRAVRGTA